MTAPEMSLAAQDGQLGFLGTHQFWTSAEEQEEYFTMMKAEHNLLHKLCYLVIQHDTTVQHASEAVKSKAALQLFNKILSVLVVVCYKDLPAPRTTLDESNLPSRSFTLEQLEAEIHLRSLQPPNVHLTADEVTRIKQSAIRRQQFQYVLCGQMACSLLIGCVLDDRRENFVASVDNGTFLRAQHLARKDIQWREAGLWTARYTDDRLTRYLAMYVKDNAENDQPANNDSLWSLRTERRKAIELHSTFVRINTPGGIPIGQTLLGKTRDSLRRIIVDLDDLIKTEDARASMEAPRDAPDDRQVSEDTVSAPQEQDASLETGDGEVVLDQPAIAQVLIEVLDQAGQPAAEAPLDPPHHAVGTVAIAAHTHREKNKKPVDEQNQDGQTPEELVRTFPAEYLINRGGAHGLSGRQRREILQSTFSDRQRKSIRLGYVSGYAARRDPFVGVHDEDVREEVREFAHGPTNTIEGVPADGSPTRDVPWSDAVDESMFQPDERTSATPNQTGEELDVDEAFNGNPEEESLETTFGE